MAKNTRRLDRPRAGQGRMIAGVAGGIAEHYGWNATVIRIIFLITAFTGVGEFVYLVMWLIMPKRGS